MVSSRPVAGVQCGPRRRSSSGLVGSSLLAGVFTIVLAACGGGGQAGSGGAAKSDEPRSTATAASPGPTSPSPHVTVVEITVTGKAVSPPPGRVEIARGATVRLVVHSDSADEVHLHGYDREVRVAPGQDGVIDFVADQTGLFEVETHESGLVLTQLLVR